MTNSIQYVMKGMIHWKVEKDGLTTRESTTYSNLILNQGLDFVAAYSFADCFKYCAVGSGTDAPIKTDKGLKMETKRTNNYSLEAESSGTALTNNIYKLFRTFVFVGDAAPYTFGEVGFSPLSSAGNNLFSKALIKDISGAPIVLNIEPTESLTIRYELSIEIYDASKSISKGISSVNLSSGELRIQEVGLKSVLSTGATGNFDTSAGSNEPCVISNIFISDNASAPDIFNSCINRTPSIFKTGSLSNYQTSSYRRNKGVLFKKEELSGPFRSIGVGSATNHGAIFVFDQEQTPEVNRAYLINFTYVWIYQSPSTFTPWLDSEDANYLHPRIKKNNSYAYFAL